MNAASPTRDLATGVACEPRPGKPGSIPNASTPEGLQHSELRQVSRGRPWKRRLVVAVVGVIALAAIVLLLARGSGASGTAHSAAQRVSDVPRAEGNRIVFTDRFRQRAGIKTAMVTQAPLVPMVSVIGTATFSPAHTAAVGARVRGLVRRVMRFEGDEVKEGEVLAQINSAELAEAQASAATYRAEKEAASLNATREQELMQRQLSTAREFEQSQAELKRYSALLGAAEQKVQALGGGRGKGALGVYDLRAPMTGVVVERHISPGQSVVGDVVAYRVTDLDYLWVELALYEKHLLYVRVDDRVELRPLNAPEVLLDGRVKHIAAQIDPFTRTAELRVEIDNHARKLRPGQSVTAQIHATGAGVEPVTVVPPSAVTYVDGKPTVFVAEGPDGVEVRPIELGHANDREQQVLAGLKVGEQIVSEGVFALKSELFR
jgi:cobalt-zinc-cadmium efflux system membrane fusion protein